MTVLHLRVDDDARWFLPGGTVRGTVSWRFESTPESLEVRLFWFTRGKGTEEAEVVEELTFENPGIGGERAFAFRLPEGPYSFSGKLISLMWAIEAVAEPGSESEILEFVMAPTPNEVNLRTPIES